MTNGITKNEFGMGTKAQLVDASFWQIRRWIEKGLVKFTKAGWVAICSDASLQDVRNEPGLLKFVFNDGLTRRWALDAELSDCLHEQSLIAQMRSEGRHDEIDERVKAGRLLTDASLDREIERLCVEIYEMESEVISRGMRAA